MNTIERLREVVATGTPLPWQNEQDVYSHGEPHAIAVWNPVDGHCRVMAANRNFPDVAKADAAKAIAAVNSLPALLAVAEAAARIVAMRSFHGTQDAHEMEYADREDKLADALRKLWEVKP